jgi:hypothetical protein
VRLEILHIEQRIATRQHVRQSEPREGAVRLWTDAARRANYGPQAEELRAAVLDQKERQRLAQLPDDLDAVRHVRAVVLLRAGRATQALELLRPLALSAQGATLRPGLGAYLAANYAVTLALTGNVAGAESVLGQMTALGLSTGQSDALRCAIGEARRSFTWRQRLAALFGGFPVDIQLPMPPGEFDLP